VRLVLDTNVVISALLWRGTPYRLLETIRRQEGLQLYSSSALLEELADVARRPAFNKHLATIGKTAPEIFVDYLEAIELVEPTRHASRAIPTMTTFSPARSPRMPSSSSPAISTCSRSPPTSASPSSRRPRRCAKSRRRRNPRRVVPSQPLLGTHLPAAIGPQWATMGHKSRQQQAILPRSKNDTDTRERWALCARAACASTDAAPAAPYRVRDSAPFQGEWGGSSLPTLTSAGEHEQRSD
jgi:putative PIN family toxin of toxin-antitoxin system